MPLVRWGGIQNKQKFIIKAVLNINYYYNINKYKISKMITELSSYSHYSVRKNAQRRDDVMR